MEPGAVDLYQDWRTGIDQLGQDFSGWYQDWATGLPQFCQSDAVKSASFWSPVPGNGQSFVKYLTFGAGYKVLNYFLRYASVSGAEKAAAAAPAEILAKGFFGGMVAIGTEWSLICKLYTGKYPGEG